MISILVCSGGHTDSVLAVAKMTDFCFVSCGKDQTVCMWKISEEEKNVKLIAKGSGHSSYVGAIAASSKFICSASKDGILKVCNIYFFENSIFKICTLNL